VLPGEKPKPVKTHQRTAVIVPEMVGAVIGVYNGKVFSNVEVKFDMIGKYTSFPYRKVFGRIRIVLQTHQTR
jgi:ribosomal protein S19